MRSVFTSGLPFLLSLFSLCLNAQKEPNHWYFGTLAGLDFSTAPPSPATNGALNSTEGTAAISDANGALLFYTDGVNVWNNSHSIMPNGTNLLGDVSTTQSAIIIQDPGVPAEYYIFTLPAEGTGNFSYSKVDMTLDGGKGDVTNKNNILLGNVTEKMSAVHHCNGKDVWVTIHELGSNNFYSYQVTNGAVYNPVISSTGRNFYRVHGQMKFNTDGTQLAILRDTMIAAGPPYQGKAWVDLCNFDNLTGIVTYSMSILLNNWQKSYGVEFSPDNSKLYVSYYDQSGTNGGNSEVIQYNLAASNIAASGVTVGASYDPQILRALQLGPDGKIYISKSGSPFLCVINSPNLLGAACSYSDNAINVDPSSMGSGAMLGLPAFIQSYFHPSYPAIASCFETGISGTDQRDILISYNNTGADLIIINTESAFGTLEVSDLQGRKVKQYYTSPGQEYQSFPLNGLPAGMYIVTYRTPGKLQTIKIIK